MKHVPALDGFRGVAVLFVMCGHFNVLFGVNGGALGVDMFFVLSGFLITSILVKEIEETGTVSLWRFYARRALRLLPAVFITIFLFGTIDLIFGVWDRTSILKAMLVAALQYPSNWVRAFNRLGMYEFAHTWSLSIEEQFYLFWPLLLLWLYAMRSRISVIVLILTVVFGLEIMRCLAVKHGEPTVWITAATHMRIDAIFVGCLAALVRPNLSEKHKALLRIAGPAAALIILAILVWRRQYYQWEQPVLIWASGLVILHLSVTALSRLSQILSATWLRYIGRISYGLYLYHYPIWVMTVHRFGGSLGEDTKRLIGLFLLAPISFAIAAVSYRYVEEPILALKNRFRAPQASGDFAMAE